MESRALRGTKSHCQKSWGDNRSARRSAVERHCSRHHRSKTLRGAPACEVPSVEGARGERQTCQEVSAKELNPGSRGNRDLTIICQRAGILSVRSRASGGELVHEVPPVEETPGRAQALAPAPAPRRETEPDFVELVRKDSPKR